MAAWIGLGAGFAVRAQAPAVIVDALKFGAGGATNHNDYFEDYGGSAVLSNGNLVVVWRARDNTAATPVSPDGDNYGAYFRVLGLDGSLVAGPTAPYLDINAGGTGEQNTPVVAALTGGGFAMAWNSNGGPGDVGADGDTYVRVYSNTGSPVSSTSKVNESEPSGIDDEQTPVSMIALSDGGFAVVWEDGNNNTGNTDDYFVRFYNANGTPRAGSVRLGPVHNDYFEDFGGSAVLSNGNVVFVWRARDNISATPPSPDGDDYGAYFRVLGPNGASVTGPVAPYLDINPGGTGEQNTPLVAALSGGGFAITWNSNGGPGDVGTDGDTYVRVYSNTGGAISSTSKVNESEPSGSNDEQMPISLTALSGGGFAVVWKDDNDTTGNTDDYFVRVYTSTGAAANPSLRISPGSDGLFEDFGGVTALSDGGFAVGLGVRDSNNNGSGTSVDGGGFAAGVRLFNSNGTARTSLFYPYLDINADGSGSQTDLLIISDPAGGFAVAWNSNNNTNDGADNDFGAGSNSTNGGDTWTRLYSNSGVALTDTIRTHPSTPGEVTGTLDEQFPIDLLMTATARWAVVFRDNNRNTDNKDDNYVSIFDAAGPSNAAPSFNDGATAILNVNENGPASAITGLLDINDTDSGDTLSWSVTSGPSGGSLGGFPAGGTSNGGNVTPTGLTYTPTANTIGSDSFTVQISDGTDTDSITVNVTIADVDPVITANSGSIAEDASVNAAVLTMGATGDTNGLSWSITGGNTGSAFAMNSATGAVTVNGPLDFETAPSYTLTIAVDDEDAGTTADDTESVTITVTNVNDAPTADNPVADFAVNENAAANTFDLTDIFSDIEDADGSLTFSVESNSNPSLVTATVNNTTDILSVSYSGNAAGAATITVRAADSGSLFVEDSFTVTVNDVNPVITANSGSIAEDASVNDAVLTMAATGDPNGLIWSITGGNTGSAFAMNSATGAVTVNGPLDFETAPSYTLTIAVDDEDAGTTADDTESVTITVTNVNDVPTADNPVADFAVNENAAANTFDLTDIFSDIEDADGSLTFSVESNSNPSLVTATVNNTTDILSVSYSGNAAGAATIAVRAADSGSLFVEDSFTVTVNDVDPVITANSGSIAEDASVNDAVLTMAATGDTNGLIWSITGGNTGSAFAINSATGAVTVNGPLDFESTPSYTLTIAVDDEDADTTADDTESVTIAVTDVNEAPSLSLGATTGSLAENNTPNNVVTSITVNDDALGTNDLTLSGPDAGSFQINGGNLEFTVRADFETKNSYEVTVELNDVAVGPTPNDSATFTLTITNVNEPPAVDNAVADYAVNEDAPETPFNLTDIFSDIEDADSELTFSVESNSNASLVTAAVDNGTDILTISYSPNAAGTATITVRATDSGSLLVEDSFTVTVNDVNPVITANSGSLAEDASVNDAVLTMTATGDTNGLIWSITGGNTGSAFAINSTTGAVTVNGPLDFESTPSYTLTIAVDDEDADTTADDTESVTIAVTDVNEAPSLSLGATTGSLAENNTPNNVVTSITVNDDALGTNDLTLSGPDAGSFQINGGNLEFSVSADFETKSSYSVTVNIDDGAVGSTPDDSAIYTLTITDVNDAPTVDNPVGDFSVVQEAPDSSFDLTDIFSDVEDADSSLIYTVETNTNPALVSPDIDPGTDILTLNYLANQNGTTVLTIRATDSGTLFAEDTFTVEVTKLVDLVLTAEDNVDPVLAGNGMPGNLIHQIKVTNQGPSDATNIEIDFMQTLPAGVTLDGTVASQGSESGGTWTLPALMEGQMATLTLTLSVPATVPGGTDTLITSASITSVAEPLTATGDDAAEVRTSVTSPASTEVNLESGLLGNLSTSLIEQRLKVTNTNPDAVPAFRITVGDLPEDVTLQNRHGSMSGGEPFIVINQELSAGGMTEVLMQYHRSSGLADFTPEYTLEFLTAVEAGVLLQPPTVGDPLSVVRFVELADGAMLLEWASAPGKTYYVQYTKDMTTFITVLPAITAGANRTQWIDRGPPQTDAHPSSMSGLRVYRVVEAD